MATKAKKVVKGKAKAEKAKPVKKGTNIKTQVKSKAKAPIKQQPKQKPKSKTVAAKKTVKAVATKVKKPSVTVKKAKPIAAKSKLKAKPIAKPVKLVKPVKPVKAVKKPSKPVQVLKEIKSKPEPKVVKLQNVVKLKPVKEVAVKKPATPVPMKARKMEPTSAFAQAVIMSETKPSKPVTMTHLISLGIDPYSERSGEEYMNTKQKEHFQNILLRWKQQLLEEMDRTVHHLQDEAINLPDPNDRASQEEEFNLELRARDRERKLIRKIEEALQKLEDNDYGYCDSCGVEIGIRRLEARATANLCIDCKTLDEIREKQLWG